MKSPKPTGVADQFVTEHLPPRALWPLLEAAEGAPAACPDTWNCAVDLLDRVVSEFGPDRPAIAHSEGVVTYGQLMRRANQVANWLYERAAPGQRVLLRGSNSPMMIAAWLGVLKARCVAVTTTPLLRERELCRVLKKANIELALFDASQGAPLRAAAARVGLSPHALHAFGPDGGGALEAALEECDDEFSPATPSCDDPALIAFTSGTTGDAKAAVHFHRDLYAVSRIFPKCSLGVGPTDRVLCSSSLAFTYGLGAILLFPFSVGATTVLPERTDAEGVLEAIERYKPTLLFSVPTLYRLLLTRAAGHDLRSLRACVSAGEPMPSQLARTLRARVGVDVIDALGSTEMLHVFIANRVGEVRVGALGRALPGYEARIVNSRGEVLPAGVTGLLAVRGPTGCRYLDDPSAQRAYVRDGWNYPGDLCRQDEEGFFWFEARADELIVSAGHNIAPAEVEAVLMEHAKVKECAVVPFPDTERGTVAKAFVVLVDKGEASEETSRALRDFVKAELAPYKAPRVFEFVDHLPLTDTGKTSRRMLRERDAGRGAQITER
jgi:2-aminobenzoate-CoA ligase